jgi:hypothetical protein
VFSPWPVNLLNWNPLKERGNLEIQIVKYIFYEDGVNLFNWNPLKERGTLEIRIVKYIFYEDGEEVQAGRNICTQLVQSCLVLNWGATKTFIKEAYASFVEVRINKMIKTFFQISLVKYIDLDSRNRGNIFIFKYLFNSKVSSTSQYSNGKTNYLVNIGVLFVVFHKIKTRRVAPSLFCLNFIYFELFYITAWKRMEGGKNKKSISFEKRSSLFHTIPRSRIRKRINYYP